MHRRQLRLNSASARDGECVIYVMSRDQRVTDNHALLLAQKSAIDSRLPLVTLFNLHPTFGVRAKEHLEFMLEGLREVEQALSRLEVPFMVTIGSPMENITSAIESLEPKEVFFDFSPLRGPRALQKKIANNQAVPCSVVDTHNTIPLWVLSDKEEYAAHTIRRKVHRNLEEWLVEPGVLKKHPVALTKKIPGNDWLAVAEHIESVSANGVSVSRKAGENAASGALKDFIQTRLDGYAHSRNLPTEEGQSDLSPYLHFGQISSLRIALELVKASEEVPLLFKEGKLASYEGEPTKTDSINAYLEELIVRKELAENYCFYNSKYDSLDGAKDWARDSLSKHADDPRDFIYTKDDWEQAETHDLAWNAAQMQMMKTGKMHGYMRMYWAKKILEWSASPEVALETAIFLNDRYSIDGGDPNGYTGILWSIAGVHDRPWFERDVYGKIRYMNAGGLQRKFDLEGYIAKWTN